MPRESDEIPNRSCEIPEKLVKYIYSKTSGNYRTVKPRRVPATPAIVHNSGCSLWSAYDYTTLRSIHVAHNDVLRFMFHLPQYTRVSNIFVSLNIPNFSVLRRKLVYSMYKRVLASSKQPCENTFGLNFFVTSRIFKQLMQIRFSNYVC